MSPFEQVKQKYPDANQALIEQKWVIFTDYSETRSIGVGATSDEAWIDAAKRCG